jgi:long-chain acyl-CoA synthetase
MGKTLTFRDFERAVAAKIAAWLQAQGLQKGDRVAVMMPNILQNPVAIFGTLRAGLVVVNVNPLYTPRELEHQLNDAAPRRCSCWRTSPAPSQQVVARTAVKHVVVTTMGDMLGLKGLIVNLVVRKVKKLVPAWSLPGHALQAGHGGRRARLPEAGRSVRAGTTSPSCNIPAARRASPRARR